MASRLGMSERAMVTSSRGSLTLLSRLSETLHAMEIPIIILEAENDINHGDDKVRLTIKSRRFSSFWIEASTRSWLSLLPMKTRSSSIL